MSVSSCLQFETAISLASTETFTRENGATMSRSIRAVQEATFVHMTAIHGKEKDVADLLTGAAAAVHENEPDTLHWFGLKAGPASYAIIDFFSDDGGRQAHFQGKVAAALKASAAGSIEGGWNDGVAANVQNAKVLSYVVTSDRSAKPNLAVRVEVDAKRGAEEAVATFMSRAAETVAANEPGTLAFYAISISATKFAIFDAFASEADMSAHFGGQVAASLKAHADEWFEGGWDKGVLANVKTYSVLSSTY
jgi:quinol monooxygenase YgiN